eukprot:Skav229826  [mRNA]  locus=scaffold2672:200361:202830:+ [translate_table: standard]
MKVDGLGSARGLDAQRRLTAARIMAEWSLPGGEKVEKVEKSAEKGVEKAEKSAEKVEKTDKAAVVWDR